MSTIYKDLWDINDDLDSTLSYIDETTDALDVLYEKMELEGYQSGERFDEAKAISFAKRFPQYFSTLNVIRRELERNIKDIRSISESVFEAYVAQKAERKEVAV